jgi:capsular polysaccharide biosynthesis protein
LVGVLAGMVVTMIVIFVLSIFDVIIHDRKKLEENFDIPVLGVIPRFEIEINPAKEVK